MKQQPFNRNEHLYKNEAFTELVKDAVRFFNGTPVHTLPPPESFLGTGVYALYYTGKNTLYKRDAELNRLSYSVPIYVGKAVPKGWRRSRSSSNSLNQSRELIGRLREHSRNLNVGEGLSLDDFMCRFVIFDKDGSDIISTIEAALIKLHKPLWNTVVDGFGNHDPGSGRYEQAKSDWDVIHEGRAWANKCKGVPTDKKIIIANILHHLKNSGGFSMKTLEIFSGAGGLAKGLELSGFEHAAFVEFNKHACESLAENFDPEKVFFGDIKDFDLDSLGTCDVVAGGPPCQPFSLGGKHKANQDSRDMFPYAIRAIERLSPKAFVFENVKGLLRQTFSDYFEYIILRLSYPDFAISEGTDWEKHLQELRNLNKSSHVERKYNVTFQLINAADYGVPQTRERVVIVGMRADLCIPWSFPTATHSEDSLLWDMYITWEYWDRHKIPKALRPILTGSLKEKIARLYDRYGMFEPESLPWQTIRDALFDAPDPKSNHGIIDHIFRDGARTYPGHTGSDFDWPSKTIKAGGHGVPGGENMIRFNDGSVRYLTTFEAKRIQTFPDNFVIKGAWGEAMRQIGNAVPVLLAEKIGYALAKNILQ